MVRLMWRGTGAVLALLMGMSLLLPVASVGAADPLAQGYFDLHVGDNGDGYGFNVDALSLDGPNRDTLFGKLSDAQFGWMRQQVRWSSYEPSKGQFGNPYVAQVDSLIDAAAAKGVKVMLSPVSSPDWAGSGGGLPKNPQDFADFIGFMADRYKGKVAAYEVWNEQNYAVETGGTVNVAAYIPILKVAYTVLKGRDQNITVVFGGMTPTNTNDPSVALDEVQYLTQIYQINRGEVKKYFDVLGAHPGSNCNPPDNSYPDNPATNPCGTDADGSRSYANNNAFYFKRILQLRDVLEQNGEGGKKMWLTEFGWDSTPGLVVKNYEYAQYNAEDQQAQYLTHAFELGKSYPWMGVMFVWNLNFEVTTNNPSDEKYGWGVLKPDWSSRPAYDALKNLPK